MPITHIWREETVEANGLITVSAKIELPEEPAKHLWYRLPAEYGSLITHSCDPFVVATILLVMSRGAPTVVHGEVSPSLLQNLAEFQAAWACWRPEKYHKVEITAEVERELSPAEPPNQAIAAFSGGVDSCFTLLRHHQGLCGRLQRPLKACLMVHGFDIPLAEEEVFVRAAAKSQNMVASLGVKFIPMATNYREFGQDWEDAHGTATASCLMLLQKSYSTGLIGSFLPYQSLKLPWGTNPITDGLLSSKTFQSVHDGAAFTRLEKIELIAKWSEALQNLRVCWQGSEKDRNCCRCEKCIRTILAFRAIGADLPPCFEQDISDAQILNLQKVKSAQLDELALILETARAKDISDSWVKALEKSIERNRRVAIRQQRQKALKQQLQKHLPPTLLNLWRRF
ncbi:MAG: hypothetical protein F6K58_26780 [Symploca sp. SIO2E9]|nr:hypothetical protein [Symploca sp. SIO2E9]